MVSERVINESTVLQENRTTKVDLGQPTHLPGQVSQEVQKGSFAWESFHSKSANAESGSSDNNLHY